MGQEVRPDREHRRQQPRPAAVGPGDRGFSWQPLPVEPPAPTRPKGATPFRVPLVPAANPARPQPQHGPPLAFGSCNPLAARSSHLTVGVGDGSPAFARSTGSYGWRCSSALPGPPEDSDVTIRFSLTNVMRAADLSEYTGELRTELRCAAPTATHPAPLRTRPRWTSRSASRCPATRRRAQLDASTCSSSTSVNAVVPLAVEDTQRAVWELGQVQVYDGGADGDADTAGDNTLF